MAENRRLAEPSGTPHDIAMMAYRIAERVMAQYERHEHDCNTRWQAQKDSMDALRDTTLANFQNSAVDRTDIREKLDYITTFLVKTGVGLISSMFVMLVSMAAYIVLHR